MNHQTYEEWALMPEYLSPEEQKALEMHQQECESCRRISENWSKVESMLIAAPPVSPKPGFTARFAASLEERKRKEHKRQTRKFLIVLGIVFLVTISAASIYYYTSNSPAAIIENLFDTGAQLVMFWENIKTVAASVTNLAPTLLLVPVVGVMGIIAAGMTAVWMATIWRFSLTGRKLR